MQQACTKKLGKIVNRSSQGKRKEETNIRDRRNRTLDGLTSAMPLVLKLTAAPCRSPMMVNDLGFAADISQDVGRTIGTEMQSREEVGSRSFSGGVSR
jgi:hypothetical protein